MSTSSTTPEHVPAPFTRHITTHSHSGTSSSSGSADAGPDATFHALSGPGAFQRISPGVQFSLVYTSDAHPTVDTQHETDITAHEARLDGGQLGLVNPAGSVCRVVEYAPLSAAANEPAREFMHRTESLDYGIVLFGEVELTLPGEPPRLCKTGDIVVQRGTLHSWRNASTTKPARMVFVLIAADVTGPTGAPLHEHLPPLPKELADRAGVPEGVEGSKALMRAKRS